jgi:thiamine-monophosphate kinase
MPADAEPPSWRSPPADREDLHIAALLRGRPRVGPAPLLDVGDDIAILADGTAIGADMLVEGVHFDARLSPADVGFKAVMVNASDLGATGARPAWMTLSLALPRGVAPGWVDNFALGLHEACAALGVRLVGGDTTASPGPVVASISMGGRLAHGRALRRSDGQAGDLLALTGQLGAAAAGFYGADPEAAWLRRPRPPVGLGADLAGIDGVHAMMDLSDGLARDLSRLCAASGLGARVSAAALPLAPSLPAGSTGLAWATAFGEDYGLLLSLAPDALPAAQALAAAHGEQLTVIGALVDDPEVLLDGGAWPAPLFAHFPGSASPPSAAASEGAPC